MHYNFLEKKTGRVASYGSLKALFDVESEFVARKKQTLYNSHDFDIEDYDDNLCKISYTYIKRSKSNII